MISFPPIILCDAIRCAHNAGQRCRADGVTIGQARRFWAIVRSAGRPEPRCGMFDAGPCTGYASTPSDGRVGTCHVADCLLNLASRCTAACIVVGQHGARADCRSFRKRNERDRGLPG